eukprot:366130-Chlamydomonas_euryale.AAC.76
MQRAPLSRPRHNSAALSDPRLPVALRRRACAVQGSCKSHRTAWARPCKPHGMKTSPIRPIPRIPKKSCDVTVVYTD